MNENENGTYTFTSNKTCSCHWEKTQSWHYLYGALWQCKICEQSIYDGRGMMSGIARG